MQARRPGIEARHGPRVYTWPVPRPTKAPKRRPDQGARLLQLRQAAGLTQAQLADYVGVAQNNIAFWEWSDKAPRGDVLPLMAKALGVRVDDLLVDAVEQPAPRRAAPMGEVQRAFEEVRTLPRKQQRRVVEMVNALVEQYRRKAS